ncbi:AsmA family protein [Ruegeria sp. 2205SS24-7]|uniref:AsmA family protein n=1 Tax=Ruegeria discodermiae TaxID=3064389 RepID=UPI0027403978|nr:AsmA family protein [Ruegeria sp. 2205SS24-7]MDP5219289.1 AsmA family protein [Ruegeria sp. 2205SS24-7]
MRWLFRIVFIVVAVLGLVIGVLLLLPGEKLAQIAADQIRAETGREVTFDGKVKVSFWPVLGLESGPVTIANAPWATSGPMLSADRLSVGVSAPDLLTGTIRIKQLLADRPVLRLDVQGDKANWDLSKPHVVSSSAPSSGTGSGSGTDEQTAADFSLEKLVLSDAQLIYTRDGKVDFKQTGVDLTARWPLADGPLDLELALSLGGDPLAITAEIAKPQLLNAGSASPVTLDIKTSAGSVGFDGRFSRDGDAEGNLVVTSTDTPRLLAALGQGGIDIPRGLGRAASFKGKATYTNDGRLSLRKMVLKLDGNQIKGGADVQLAAKPNITANLRAGTLDFSKTAPTATASSGGGGAASSGQSTGWSTSPIDASLLGLANATINLTAQAVKLPEFDLGKTQVTLKIERSRAVLRMKEVSVFSGLLSGRLVANNRSGLSVGGDLTAQDIDLNQALSALADVTRFSGQTSGKLKFLGVGQTEDQIMHSLSGSGSISMGKGVISGFDLHRLMDGHTRTGGTTVFNSLTASFTMENGDLDNQDLLLKLDNYRADGKGRIGIGARDIDYLFTPVLLRANSGKGREVPIRINGPWSDPSIRPDLKKVIEAAAEAELDKVADTAKKALHGKLGEELDAPVENTADVEKALKNKLEEEAKKGLLKLFGGD